MYKFTTGSSLAPIPNCLITSQAKDAPSLGPQLKNRDGPTDVVSVHFFYIPKPRAIIHLVELENIDFK